MNIWSEKEICLCFFKKIFNLKLISPKFSFLILKSVLNLERFLAEYELKYTKWN